MSFTNGETDFFQISLKSCRKRSIARYSKSPMAQRAILAMLTRTAAETTNLYQCT